jgi:hypothetical protein
METSNRNIVTLKSVKAINGGKVSLEFTQIVNQSNASASLTSLLNADDERFNQSKPRHAWLAVSPALVKEHFGIDCSDLKVGEILEIDQEEPTINGQLLNIQLTETVKGSEYDNANVDKAAKRAGKDGDFILTAKGEFIFTRVDVVAGPAKHVKITETMRQSSTVSASDAIADVLGAE